GPAFVLVGGVPAASVLVVSDTQLVCVFPPGTPGAVVNVVLSNQNGSTTLSGGFRYHSAPTITSVLPGDSAAITSLRVTLTGTGYFDDQAGTPVITFGGVAASGVQIVGDQSLRCNAPIGTPGRTVDVVLANARGTATLTGGFRYHAKPTVTVVTPNRGSSQGGTAITLTGTGFAVDSPGANAVTFGNVPATNVVVLSDTA